MNSFKATTAKGVLLILSAGFLFSVLSCKKDKNSAAPLLYYSYFPLKTGMYRIYDADSLIFYTDRKRVHFQLKEVVASTGTNDAGETVYRIERYTRADTSQPWQILNVYADRRNVKEAIRKEGNTDYVKLVFPVQYGIRWDANRYNMKDSFQLWKSLYNEVHKPYQQNGISFDSTLQVELENNEDFISLNIYYERYATGIGLISLNRKEIEIQPGKQPGDPPDTTGYYYDQFLTEYGK